MSEADKLVESIFRSDAALDEYRKVIARAAHEYPQFARTDGLPYGFARSFESIESRVFRYRYGNVLYASVIPAPLEQDPAWADKTTYRMLNGVGKAKFLDSLGSDAPRVELSGDETSQPIRRAGASFDYDFDDLQKAAVIGYSVSAEKAIVARRACEELVDSVCALGDANTGIPSFVKNASLTQVTKGTQASGTTWVTATPAEILKDWAALCAQLDTATKFSFGANQQYSLVVGSKNWSFLTSRLVLDTGYIMGTWLDFLLKSYPRIKEVLYWPQLDTAGAASAERVICGIRDPEVLSLVMPQPFTMSVPEARNLAFVVNCHIKTGGTKVRNWAAWCYMDGTQP